MTPALYDMMYQEDGSLGEHSLWQTSQWIAGVFSDMGWQELLEAAGEGHLPRPLEEMAKQFSDLEKRSQPRPPVQPGQRAQYTTPYTRRRASPDDVENPEYFLRPPGARDEQDFLNVCSRCGNCVTACPVQAIQLDYSSHRANGAPYIDPNMAACTMCDELACMNQCCTTQ